jgi:hypothetical protein
VGAGAGKQSAVVTYACVGALEKIEVVRRAVGARIVGVVAVDADRALRGGCGAAKDTSVIAQLTSPWWDPSATPATGYPFFRPPPSSAAHPRPPRARVQRSAGLGSGPARLRWRLRVWTGRRG